MKFGLTAAFLALIPLPTHAQDSDWRDDYQVIKIGILSGENQQDRLARNEPLRAYLQDALGVNIEIFTAGNYDGVVQAMAADQIEFAFFGSSSYAAIYTETGGGVRPLLAAKAADGSTGYYSVIVTRCEDGYSSIDDLKGKIHAFADPDSTSGYAVPYYNLVQQGYDSTTFFAAIPFSGSHEAGVQGVANGTFDSASTYQENEVSGVYQNMVEKGMIEAGVICPIWQSPEITEGPFTVRNNLPDEMVEDVTAALEAFPKDDPEGYRTYTNYSPEDENPEVGYARVDHDRYQWIVDMRKWLAQQRRG